MGAQLQRFDCTIKLDTERTIKNMTECLIEEFGVWGGMIISENELCFVLYDRSMSYAMCGLHTIANLFATVNTEYTVSIWESGIATF